MFTALLVIDILVCLGLIGLILMQHGKGADVGAAFGSGASQTVFGSGGSGSFLTRATAILAVLFFAVSLSLSYLSAHRTKGVSLLDSVPPSSATAPITITPTQVKPDSSGLPASLLQGAKPGEVPAAPPAAIPDKKAPAVVPAPQKPADVPGQ